MNKKFKYSWFGTSIFLLVLYTKLLKIRKFLEFFGVDLYTRSTYTRWYTVVRQLVGLLSITKPSVLATRENRATSYLLNLFFEQMCAPTGDFTRPKGCWSFCPCWGLSGLLGGLYRGFVARGVCCRGLLLFVVVRTCVCCLSYVYLLLFVRVFVVVRTCVCARVRVCAVLLVVVFLPW